MDLSKLQSRVSSSYIPPHRTQLHPRTILYPNPRASSSSSNRDKCLILFASLFVFPFLFYLFYTALGVHQSSKFGESKTNLFGIIINASPTHSRIHVFEFLNPGSTSLEVKPGLSWFAGDPEGAGRSVVELIEFAKKRVPKSEWRNTVIVKVSSSYIPPHRTQLHPRTILYPNPRASSSSSNRDKCLILFASLFVFPFLFYTALGVHQSSKFGESKTNLFGIIINASPTHSRIHVFEFLNPGSTSLEVKPGLSWFAGDPEGAGRSVVELIEFAKKRVPKSEWRNTKVQLMGSSELERVELVAREAIFESCRRVLWSSGFLFKNEWLAMMEGEILLIHLCWVVERPEMIHLVCFAVLYYHVVEKKLFMLGWLRTMLLEAWEENLKIRLGLLNLVGHLCRGEGLFGPATFERLALCPVLNEDRPPQECIIDQDEGMQCALYPFVLEEHISLPLWLTLLLVTIMSLMERQLEDWEFFPEPVDVWTQVAFSPRDPQPMQLSQIIKLAGVTYNLYTKSIPYFGQDAIWESLCDLHNSKDLLTFSSSREDIASNPCIPRGYDFASNASDAKLLRSYAIYACIHLVKEYHLPLLQSRLVPPDKFFFISEFFGLAPTATLSELEAAGHHYCEDDWYQLKRKYHSTDDLDLLRYCFSSAYVVALLHDSFGIPMTDKRHQLIKLDLFSSAIVSQTNQVCLGVVFQTNQVYSAVVVTLMSSSSVVEELEEGRREEEGGCREV
ncbi:hypothetical protein TEA_005502 [Camellia sinensis var. sinensis]|uniref:Uncharacterized protein n=1 Tax=Camellia sinensis var. sinensis TaxID=542762 RepID=A0A4S4EGJ1_CAMSN|nr:hypothetical protein TEA_005502 [Camellia sinensis var. sinensis]